MSRCRSCHAEILWVVTAAGRRMPVDAEPVEGGNVAITGVNGRQQFAAVVLGPADRLRAELDDGRRYVSHYATCPDADQWRNRPKPLIDGPGQT